VVNDRTAEPDFPRVDWSELHTLVRTSVVIEDAINLDRAQLASVKKLLNFSNHHAQVRLSSVSC
jgi:hypothetical protein